MKRYKRYEEGKKYNSGFNGIIIEHVPARIAKKVASILDENEIIYDMLKDLNYYQFITDLEKDDINFLKDVMEIIEDKTGFKMYDYKLNR